MKSAFVVLALWLSAMAGTTGFPAWGPANASSDSAVRGQDPVARLLAENVGGIDTEMLAYAKRCENAAARYPGSALKAALCKQIGDVYYELDRTRFARKWGAWYRKAVAAQPALAKDSPAGYRLQEYSRFAMRWNLIAGVFAVYAFTLLAFIVRGARGRRTFDTGRFLKRCAFFAGVYGLLAAAVFAIDTRLFAGSIGAAAGEKPLSAQASLPGAIINPVSEYSRPFIPLSVCDSSDASRAAIILLLGFLPIALCLWYASFRKPFSRPFLFTMILALCLSLWLHFLLVNGSDRFLTPRVTVTKSRVIFSGEPEVLLLKDPRKALRANPGLLKSGNDDLEEFLEKHYPGGFPGKR